MLLSAPARASVSITVTFDGLVGPSSSVAVVTPIEQHSVWENNRIYTYTQVHVDTKVAGALNAGADAWVRTMGGIVGKIGQVVDGEAVLTVGRPSLLFLHEGTAGSFEVTARAQGQFALVLDNLKQLHVVKSSGVGYLMPPQPSGAGTPSPLATDVIHGRPVSDAARDIAAVWSRLHAR